MTKKLRTVRLVKREKVDGRDVEVHEWTTARQDVAVREWAEHLEKLTNKMALGNLYLQKELEEEVDAARAEFAIQAALLERLSNKAEESIAELDATPSPPAAAAFLLSFMAPKNAAQAFLGDLQEMFQKNVQRLGVKQARRMYWMQVAASAWPLLWTWIKRIGFFTALADYVRSKFGL